MNLYQIFCTAFVMLCFCAGLTFRAWQSCRADRWWGKLLTFFGLFVVVGLIGGMSIYSVVLEYRHIGQPVPHIALPGPPPHWWRN